jgi:hypothetical protein
MSDEIATEAMESKSEISEEAWLKLEADEAVKHVMDLESKQRDALRIYNETSEALPEAKNKREEALAKLYAAKPRPLPPLPTHEEFLKMARSQRRDADDRETVLMATRLHGMLSDGRARAGERINLDPPEMTGTEVRNVEDHRYDIPAPPREPRERKSYG